MPLLAALIGIGRGMYKAIRRGDTGLRTAEGRISPQVWAIGAVVILFLGLLVKLMVAPPA